MRKRERERGERERERERSSVKYHGLPLLNNLQVPFFKIIFSISGSGWWRKNPILAQALLTISLVIFGGRVKLFVVWKIVSYIHLSMLFFVCYF